MAGSPANKSSVVECGFWGRCCSTGALGTLVEAEPHCRKQEPPQPAKACASQPKGFRTLMGRRLSWRVYAVQHDPYFDGLFSIKWGDRCSLL